MKLFLIRHADAIEHETDTVKDDEHRFITASGRTVTGKIAETLKDELKDLEIIFTSPLVRAVQTAEIISTKTDFDNDILLVNQLKNESTNAALLKLLSDNADMTAVALVGHEPRMGMLVKALSDKKDMSDFKKSSVCLIEFHALAGQGKFKWYFNSKTMEFEK